MRNVCWKIIAVIGLMVFSQTASTAMDQPDVYRVAQAAESTAPVAPPPVDSKAAPDPSPPAVASTPSPTATAEVTKAGPSTPGCALRYMAAELAGKLKGRKWKKFHQEERGASKVQGGFPHALA